MARARKYPQIGVAVFIENQTGDILLSLKKTGNRKGWLCLPGGHLEFGESLTECAVREVQEETGLNLNPKFLDHIGITQERHESTGNHYVTHYYWWAYPYLKKYANATLEPENLEPHKHHDWEWIDPATASKKRKLNGPVREILVSSMSDPIFQIWHHGKLQTWGF